MKPQNTIAQINEILETNTNRDKINSFLSKFSECEVYVRYYLKKYYQDCGEQIKDEDIKLIREDIKDALNDYGIYFEDDKLLTEIFGQKSKKGERSCKQLRNKITHLLKKSEINEVINNYEMLINKMDEFIEKVIDQS